ncbi:GNAT family N-acetyltransferase [Cyclobacterium jeungdonense]|uniref:GNAT family N-acetyltransferase n=1 Tax=Cyclobacterium jeungdonense TaxID=708087 RepID=A0ABT8CAI7_9BACT|nr:GNAT family N-acetyltransferase [Cyclobacterium jeungdonense]MDN3689391.1 GNAT family N-acetyltransferase [Cyclobacterium jeungdonense]
METVKILPFSDALAPYFLAINREWIEQYFFLEPFDLAQLQTPRETLINSGGEVLFAEWKGEIVGTVGLKSSGNGQYELIKMGVLPKARGQNIGMLLGQAALDWAKKRGAQKVLLYSNSILVPAIALYRKLGFREIPMEPGTYQRCDVKMEYLL